MADCRAPVAVFDSGLGGISVLRELVRTLPMENYLYFGDSLHAPYGTKTPEEVTQLSLQAAQKLLAQGAKALVVACNTATSAAIRTLRKTYPALAIVGTEPAIKPAAERHPGGRILMLATAMTIRPFFSIVLWISARAAIPFFSRILIMRPAQKPILSFRPQGEIFQSGHY